jgi:hypothetical protein
MNNLPERKFFNFIGYNKFVGGNYIASIPNTDKAIFQRGTANNIEYFLTKRAYYIDTKNGKLPPGKAKLRYQTMTNNRSSYGTLYDIYVSDGLNFHRILNTSEDNISGNLERAINAIKNANKSEIDRVTDSAVLIN